VQGDTPGRPWPRHLEPPVAGFFFKECRLTLSEADVVPVDQRRAHTRQSSNATKARCTLWRKRRGAPIGKGREPGFEAGSRLVAADRPPSADGPASR
jgi:hypothetical protein